MNFKRFFLTALPALLFLACRETPAPEPLFPVPTPGQIAWQKMETYAFVHFGLNTFNDLEWGYGNTPASTFRPTRLDCRQWVQTVKAAGLKGVILTAKHHDGFCLWPTKTVDYNISRSPYKDGKGDMVRELSEACREAGLKFGLYLSPWDRHHAEYGREGYREVYHSQIRELVTDYGPLFEFWFDGANGGNGWYGGADESRSIDAGTYYGYEEARRMIKAVHPEAMVFGGTVPDIRWIGNENGVAGETNWAMYDGKKEVHYRQAQWGMEEASGWLPGECDVSIRPGWFYHRREDHQVKTVPALVELYYRSVGRNANFLLNFPVALDGRIHPVDSARAVEWYRTVRNELREDLLAGIEPEAGDTRGRKFDPANVTDGNWDSYWATSDGKDTSSLVFALPGGTQLNRVLLQEYIPLGQRVRAFAVEVKRDGSWLPVESADSMTTIGYKRIIRFRTTPAEALRIRFTASRGPLCINTVEAYCAPALLAQPLARRDASDRVYLAVPGGDADIHYTTDGTIPTAASPIYDGPFVLSGKGTVKAVCHDRAGGKSGPVLTCRFDLPASAYRVVSPEDSRSALIFDGSGHTSWHMPEGEREVRIRLSSPHVLSGFAYTPDQGRDAAGHISHYELLVDGKKVASGEFSNILHNPVRQEVHFAPVKGRDILFRCLGLAGGARRVSIGEFSVITEDRE